MAITLFDDISKGTNLLPYEGEAIYCGRVIDPREAAGYHDILMQSAAWRHDEAVIFGRHIITKRKVAWYGDEPYAYTYSNITRNALPWTRELAELKAVAEKHTGEKFNSCLLNLYHNGDEGMAWHSDDEVMLEKNGAIASMSFGEERRFLFRHRKTKETISLQLEPGSLLVMKGTTQTHWLHSLPKAKAVMGARINLTFRKMVV